AREGAHANTAEEENWTKYIPTKKHGPAEVFRQSSRSFIRRRCNSGLSHSSGSTPQYRSTTCTHLLTHLPTHLRTHLLTHTQTHTQMHTHTYTYIHTDLYTTTFTLAHTHTHAHTQTHECTYIGTLISTYTHSHSTHTPHTHHH